MMSSIKYSILLSVVLFGAYSQHQAEKMVDKIKLSNTQLERQNKGTGPADHTFMLRALELSQLAIKADNGDPFGSVLVKDGKIIGEGWNRTRLLKDPSAHAEIEAIRDACKKLNNSDLSGSAIYASAQPCPMCLSLIYMTGIERIYYCIPNAGIEKFDKDLSVDFVYGELVKSQSERTIPEVQLLPEYTDKYIKSYTTQ